MTNTPEKRFRVALSFPGEKRDFVKQVAESLAQNVPSEKILYDKWYEEEFARADLKTYLPDLYHRESDLVVVFHGKDYMNKDWCGAEWNAIQSLIHRRRVDSVLLCRFDRDAEIPGLYDAGYIEIEDESNKRAQEVAELIIQRLDKLKPGVAIPSGDFVYVCEPPDDVEMKHIRLIKDLEDALAPHGISVVAHEFRKKPELIDSIPELLSAARFVIQLHGRKPVRKSFEEFGDSIEYWLLDELQKLTQPNPQNSDPPNKIAGETWLRWRSDELKPDHIADEPHRNVVFDADNVVINMPDVKFREFVVETICRRRESERLPEIEQSRILVRSINKAGRATGDLCDRIDTWKNEAGKEPLQARVVLRDVPLKAMCDAFRKKSLRPGGLFVVSELPPDAVRGDADQWVDTAMLECRRAALDYRPILPVCLVYSGDVLTDVPGRFRVINYQPIDDEQVVPVEEDELNKALKKAEEVQQ